MAMKIKVGYFLLFLIFMGSSMTYSEERQWHYFDIDHKPLTQYEFIYDKLKDYFKDSVPKNIIVKYTTGNTSQFDTINEAVLSNEFSAKNDLSGIIAHESCHLCMANFTKMASVREEFRFFDEGFADIFQSTITSKSDDFKNESLTIAALQNNRNNVNFEKVQKWSEYFGNPQIKTNFYAYPVGSSFDFFVIDTYGMDRLITLFKDIGKTQDLEKSLKNVFKNDKQSIESKWLQYLKKVNVSSTEPHIIEMFPANLATNVSIKTNEIYVEFDIPMSRNIFLITNCNDGICYKNAYWKTDKILAVKVNLLPNYQYQVYLGDNFHGRFMSKVGIELPITSWSFNTGSE
jgi:hypothetical protein